MDAMTDEADEAGSIADELAACSGDPERFVDTMFDWTAPELEGKAPEKWQREILRAIKDGLPLHRAVRIACASGHGSGKTCLTSWIILWAMSTCGDCRGILTASNEAQLYTRNRAELRKWIKLFKGREFFELTATALISTDPERQQSWRLDLLPFNEQKFCRFAQSGQAHPRHHGRGECHSADHLEHAGADHDRREHRNYLVRVRQSPACGGSVQGV